MNANEKAAWLSARCGRLSASRMADAMDRLKNGKPGTRRAALLKELCAERMTSDSVPHYVDARMQRGLDLEPEGKGEYEMRTGRLLQPVGFVTHPDIPDFGATSDALVTLPHGVATWEMKAPDTVRHIEYILAGQQVPEQYQPQVVAQCAVHRLRHVVFVSYDPRVLNPAKRMHIVEWEVPAERIEEVEAAAREFLAELEALFDAVATA